MVVVLIHNYRLRALYGISDFLRASLNLFSFCKKRNFEYFIDFSDDNLNKCFDIQQSEIPKNSKSKIVFGQTNFVNFREKELELKLDGKNFVEIDSNCINITSELYIDEFNLFLRPSKLVLDYIENQHLPKNYQSVHIRAGDCFISKKSSFNIQNAVSIINKWKTTDVLIFSDNEYLKQEFKIYGFLIHDMKIIHTTTKGVSYIETIAEFYMIMFSTGILAFNYSGFSHLSSFLGKVKYTNVDNNIHLNYLNEYIQKFI